MPPKNQFVNAHTFCDIFANVPVIKQIATVLVTGTRWLIMKSCKEPAWPPEIEAESAIARARRLGKRL